MRLGPPAHVGTIVTEGRLLDEQAVGCRRHDGRFSATPNELFHLGSDEKATIEALLALPGDALATLSPHNRPWGGGVW